MLVFAKCLNSIPLEFNQANGQKNNEFIPRISQRIK